MSDVVGRGVIELVTDARKLRAGIDEAKKSIRTLGEGQRDISRQASRSIDEYIGRLHAHNATIGKSSRETELYRLALRGASNEQLKSADTALKLTEQHERSASALAAVRSGFAVLGTLAAAGAIAAAAAFDQLLNKAGNFQDLAEKIGDTASNVASLSVAASVGNISMEAVAQAANILTKNLVGVDDESSAAGAAVAALGLNLEELRRQAPTERLFTIANAFERFSTEGDRAAVAIALLGRSGADALPFLRELSSGVGKQSILTDDQIRLADEYSDRQKKLSAEISLHAQAIAIDLLPQLLDLKQGIADLAKDQEHAATASGVLQAAIGGVVVVFQTVAVLASDVGFVLLSIGREIGALAAQFSALQKLDFSTFNAISKAVKEDGERARAELDKFQARVMAIGTSSAKAVVEGAAGESAAKPEAEKPKLEFLGAQAANDQIKLIEQVAKASQNAIEKEVALELAATQARLASRANLLTAQKELEHAELEAIGKRVAAAQAAFETEKAISRARGDSGTKANIELIASGTKLYDSLTTQANNYLNVFKQNQAQILALDKQLVDSRKSTAELIRSINEEGLTEDQKAGALRMRLLEGEDKLRLAIATGNAEKQKEIFAEQQRNAKELADLGFTSLGKTFLEDNQALFERGLAAQTQAAKSISAEAKQGAEAVAEQLGNLKGELANISENALSGVKIRADQGSLSGLVSDIRNAIERETFKVNLQPQGVGIPAFAEGGRASGLALVGERGPELVRFTSPAQVYSAPDTRKIFRDMGGSLVRALADGGIVKPGEAVPGGSSSQSDVVVHDLRVNGVQVGRVQGPRDVIKNLMSALNQDAQAIA